MDIIKLVERLDIDIKDRLPLKQLWVLQKSEI